MAVPGLDPGIRPGHPDPVEPCAFPIGITGTGPAMTGEAQAKWYVLTLFLTQCITWAITSLIPARRGARSRGVADVGRGAVLQQASHVCWQEALGSRVLVQVETPKSTACEEASWLFPSP
jgi:hypothetical protein